MATIYDMLAKFWTPRGGMAGFQKWQRDRQARQAQPQPQAPSIGQPSVSDPGAEGGGGMMYAGGTPGFYENQIGQENPFGGAPLQGQPIMGDAMLMQGGAPGGTMFNPTAGAPQPSVPFGTGTMPTGGATRGLAGQPGTGGAGGPGDVPTADQPSPAGQIGGGTVGPGAYQPAQGQIGGFQGPKGYGALQDRSQRRMRQQKAGMGASGGTSGSRATPSLSSYRGNPFGG